MVCGRARGYAATATWRTRLCLLQYRNVRVCIFPQREEIFVSRECSDEGSFGIRALRGPRLQSVCRCHAQMRQRSRPAGPQDAAVVEYLLKLSRGSTALSGWL